MTFEFETSTPEEMGQTGGDYLSQPGKYHLNVLQVREDQGPKGNPIDGFTVECQVLAGTTAGQEQKHVNITLWKPRLDRSEKAQAMDRKKITAFLVATNLVDPHVLGGKVRCELSQANGSQIVANLVPQVDEDGVESDKFLQLNYADLWHVDDPDAAKVPKDAEAIAMIPSQFRHAADWFSFKEAHKAASNAAPKANPAPAAAASYDDI